MIQILSSGLVTVLREAYPDHTQFDPKDPHYDPKSDKVFLKFLFGAHF